MIFAPILTALDKQATSALDLIGVSDSRISAGSFAGVLGREIENISISGISSAPLGSDGAQLASAAQFTLRPLADAAQAAKSAPAASAAPASDIQNLKMTQEDFSALKDGLAKLGLSDKEIADMSAKITSPEGLTWGQFARGVREKVFGETAPTDFSVDEKRNMTTLLGKLGFNPSESSKIMDNLTYFGPQAALAQLAQGSFAGGPDKTGSSQSGDGPGQKFAESFLRGGNKEFWSALADKFAGMGKDDQIVLSQDEMTSLAKALGLSKESRDKIGDLFAKNDGKELPLSQFKDALNLVKGQEAGQAKGSADALTSFKQTFGQTLDTAAGRAATLNQAASLSGQNQGMASAKDIRREAVKNVENKLTAIKDEPAPVNRPADPKAQAQGQAQTPEGVRPGQSQSQAQGQPQPGSDPGTNGHKPPAKDQGFDPKARADNAAKASESRETAPASTAKTDLIAQTLAPGSQTAPGSNTAPLGAAGGENYSRAEVLRQIENGFMKNLGQGTKQLSLTLDPENLGKLNVVLQVRNSEISAIIKADTPEAAKIIQDNLSQLKESLEKQGLTVSKLDVRTSLSDNGGSTNNNNNNTASGFGSPESQGQGQGQARDRQDAMRQNLAQARFGAMSADGLAREMQSMGAEARISHTGIDVIA